MINPTPSSLNQELEISLEYHPNAEISKWNPYPQKVAYLWNWVYLYLHVSCKITNEFLSIVVNVALVVTSRAARMYTWSEKLCAPTCIKTSCTLYSRNLKFIFLNSIQSKKKKLRTNQWLVKSRVYTSQLPSQFLRSNSWHRDLSSQKMISSNLVFVEETN